MQPPPPSDKYLDETTLMSELSWTLLQKMKLMHLMPLESTLSSISMASSGLAGTPRLQHRNLKVERLGQLTDGRAHASKPKSTLVDSINLIRVIRVANIYL